MSRFTSFDAQVIMRKTTLSLFSSLIYFGLAIFAVKQLDQSGPNSQYLAQFLAACAFVDVFAIALSAQPRAQHRGLMTQGFICRAAQSMRTLAAVLTLPCIVYWGTGELLVHAHGDLPHWTKSVIAFSRFKQQVEGEAAARAYLGRAADSAGHCGEMFEKHDLQKAYDYYASYVELSHAQWPSSYRPDARGTAVLGRILDKMGRYEEADRQYFRAESEVLALTTERDTKVMSNGRVLRLLDEVTKKSPLHSFVANLPPNDESTSALKLGTSFTKIDERPIVLDWRQPTDMSAGVAYSGTHMRDLLSKIKIYNVPMSERESIHTVDEFDFGKPAFSLTYMEPQSFQQYLRKCHVIMPVKTYARLKELSELQ